MAEYRKTVPVSEGELSLFEPIGKDSGDRGPVGGTIALDERFEQLGDCASWTYGPVGTEPYYDRTFTAEFDRDHILEICWTFYDGLSDGQDGGYWYLAGVRFGTADDVILDLNEESQERYLSAHPEGSVVGEYVYSVDGDDYIIEIAAV